MNISWLLGLGFILICFSCQQESKLNSIANSYFDVLAAEENRSQLESFYAEDFIFEDVFLRQTYTHKTEFLDIAYQWGSKNLERENNKFLKLNELICNDSVCLASGKFSSSAISGTIFPSNDFMIELKFDKDLKIKKQRDFVQYDDSMLDEVVQIRKSFQFSLPQNQQEVLQEGANNEIKITLDKPEKE